MRLFVELLTNGSPEERAATPEGQLSPLFEGGHGDLVKSITTISGTVIGGSLSFIGKGGKRFVDCYSYWVKFLDELPD